MTYGNMLEKTSASMSFQIIFKQKMNVNTLRF